MRRPIGQRDGHKRAGERQAPPIEITLQLPRIGSEKSPVAKLGALVARRGNLVEHAIGCGRLCS